MTAVGAAALALLGAMGEWLSFYVHELKHYSADACFGMLIPALAAWAPEASPAPGIELRQLRQRLFVFWMVAASAQWLANGALLV